MSVYHCLSHHTGYGPIRACNGLHYRYVIFMHIFQSCPFALSSGLASSPLFT